MASRKTIGWREWVQLPEFGIVEMKAKIDTGADNSSLHAFNLHRFDVDGVPHVRFEIHPRQRKRKPSVACESVVVMERKVKNPGGRTELRPVIRTKLIVAGREVDALVNLTVRDEMTFRLLLGRRTIRKQFLVDPGRSYVGVRPGQNGPMRIAILSRSSSLYSTARLKEAGLGRGHEMAVVDYLRCYMDITARRPKVLYRGDEVRPHAVIPRIGATYTFYGTAVVRQFEMAEVFTVNSSDSISRSRDKLRSMQLLSRAGVGLPTTSFAHSTQDIDGLLEVVGGTPIVVKLLEGTQGLGVVLAETRKAAESVIGAFRQMDANILVQEFVKEAAGSDIRAFIVGGKVVAAMRRTGAPGDFRSNLHRGGSAEAVKLTAKERATAVRAAKTMGLNIAGVDMLQSADGPMVLEVNSSPGLEGIEGASGVDIADVIIEYIEDNSGH